MKRVAGTIAALALLVGSGVALGLPQTSTHALDEIAARGLKGPKANGGRRPITVAKSALEVDMALKQIETDRTALEEELAQIEKELGALDARILARGRAYYKQVRAGLLPAGGGFDELVDHAARVERNRLSLTRDLEAGKKLRARRDDISDELARIAADKAPLLEQKRAFDAAQTYMRQANERRQAFDRAFSSSTEPPDQGHVAIYGIDVGAGDNATRGFSASMGKLPFPLAGRAEVTKLEASGTSGPALEFRATMGAIARSVAPGRVVFADRLDDDRYGTMTVMLDHGDRYFTVYRDIAATEVKVGESLTGGAPIGPVGSELGKALLHFEIRQEGRALDAGPWFGL